ncbi:MAG TPA: 4a-hydroxytetrahydrobiopterin dehydratase [Burkholderiaceae bacterium]|jgi:4a-hydroxytetrahydrobiopterin dehydratase|nr:4a-hydroxytetrahydrobiopterin dehydratase [Burkholderiaceae bacterium]HPE00686.1 4a-hydroxytetrahydrobiopterin dehydratase [Burkholderiaceae bacterium]HRZ00746.1 4a-hydroxytetrahydrobiopterin dehydratase [Burkholderiaceae bacterium]
MPVLALADLLAAHCRPLEGSAALDASAVQAQLGVLPAWRLHDGALERSYALRNYHETIAFVNALAWIVHAEDHHPDLAVSYARCTVRFNTHSVGGISLNDFICAAKADAVYAAGAAPR